MNFHFEMGIFTNEKLFCREPFPAKSDSLLFTLSFVELALPTQHELPLVVMFFHGNYSFV